MSEQPSREAQRASPQDRQREVWLRGPVTDVPPLLQPVAHALLQAVEEVATIARDLPADALWVRPFGLASPGFHLQHLAGVLDRLTTYAHGDALSASQLASLREEGVASPSLTTAMLFAAFEGQVARTVDVLRATPESSLTRSRAVGRSGLPSTVIGLFVHAAEHTMRHTGQLLVTAIAAREIAARPDEHRP